MPKLSESELESRKLFVYAACDGLLARGEMPRSARHVREEMQRLRPHEAIGDTTYVHRFLQDWRRDCEANDGGVNTTIISDALLYALKAELHAQAVKLKAECDARIDGMLVDAQEILGLNSKLEEQIARLEADFAERTTERDEALGALTECRNHLESCQATLADAREAAALQVAAAVSERRDLEARYLATQNEAREAQLIAERLRSELETALAAGRDAVERATSAEAISDELRAAMPLRRFLKPGRNIASKPQRFRQGMSTPFR